MSRSAPRDGCLSSVDAVDAGCAPRGVEGVDGVDDIDGVDGVGSSTAPQSRRVSVAGDSRSRRRRRVASFSAFAPSRTPARFARTPRDPGAALGAARTQATTLRPEPFHSLRS